MFFFLILLLLFLFKKTHNKKRYNRILIVKLSSLGDVIHTIPLVYDIQQSEPDVKIDWVVDASFMDLLSPIKNINIIPIELRAFKKNRNFNPFRHTKFNTYDTIIDAQGLLKSALVARYAKGFSNAKIVGLGNRTIDSGYDPLVRWFYDECVYVYPKTHSVGRTRVLYQSVYKGPPVFYTAISDLALGPRKWNKYVLFFHATSAFGKCWPIENWIELGINLAERGYTIVLPWGNQAEKERSETISFGIPDSIVPVAFNLKEAFSVILHSELVVGVDTGLTHLAAALKHRTVEIYVSTFKWKFEGYWHPNVQNIGDKGQSPTVLEILNVIG